MCLKRLSLVAALTLQVRHAAVYVIEPAGQHSLGSSVLPKVCCSGPLCKSLNVAVRHPVGCERVGNHLGNVCQFVEGALQGVVHVLLEVGKGGFEVLDVVSQARGLSLQCSDGTQSGLGVLQCLAQLIQLTDDRQVPLRHHSGMLLKVMHPSVQLAHRVLHVPQIRDPDALSGRLRRACWRMLCRRLLQHDMHCCWWRGCCCRRSRWGSCRCYRWCYR
jgi:hypothetical protein